MKYFTEEKNDVEGYREQLHTIKHRLDKEVYEITKYNRFHDGQIDFFGIKNGVDEEMEEEKLPISLECRLMDSEGDHYIIVWEEVKKFLLDYDLARHTSWDSHEIVADGLRGLDDWMCDEITQWDGEFLSHEIVLASEMKIVIHCKNIRVGQIKKEIH